MQNSIVIADSGGTKTDWRLLHKGRVIEQLETPSYHPLRLNNSFIESQKTYWRDKIKWLESDLYFFGAGCYNEGNATTVKNVLDDIFHLQVVVRSDLDAAGLSAYGEGKGLVAIMGTGSVCFYWNGRSPDKVIGGKGHLIGDEGSGYYFGKLILQKYMNRELNSDQCTAIDECISIEHLVQLIGTSAEKFEFASIAQKLSAYQELFSNVHLENIQLFYNRHLSGFHEERIIFVGTYASKIQEIIRPFMAVNGYKKVEFIERPIDRLTEQTVYFTD